MRRLLPFLMLFTIAGALAAQSPAGKPAKPTPGVTGPDDAARVGELSEKEFAALHELTKEQAPKPLGKMIELDGQHHYLALPKDKKAPLPAVLVIHEWWGLNEHIEHWADRLAAEGYVALAVDLYGGKIATEPIDAQKLMKAVDPTAATKVLQQAYDYLRDDPAIKADKVASLGWCFGGGWSLRCALAMPKLDACVLYYGQLVTDPAQLTKIEAPVLAVFGSQDRSIPAAHRAAFEDNMHKADKRVRVLTYDAEHAFANPSGARYDQKNAAAAWTEVRAFLREQLTPPPPTKGAPPTKK